VPADGGGSCEGQLPETRVAEQRIGGVVERGDHHVERPGRKAGRREDLGQRERGERRERRGSPHHAAARGQGGGDRARRDGQREVPRGHDEAGPHRPAPHQQAARPVRVLGERAREADRLLGAPLQVLGGEGDLVAGLGEGLSHLQGDEQREAVHLARELLGRPAQHAGALSGRARRPGRLSGRRGVQRLEGVLGIAVGHPAELAAGGRVLDDQGAPRASGTPPPADAKLLRAPGERVPLG